MKHLIETYFREKLNTSVSTMLCDSSSYLIKAKIKIKWLALWTNFEVEILFSKNSTSVEVSYLEGTNNLENTLNAAFFDNPLVGLCKIFGVASRRDIPLMINEKIQAYLAGYFDEEKKARKAEADKKWEEWLTNHKTCECSYVVK